MHFVFGPDQGALGGLECFPGNFRLLTSCDEGGACGRWKVRGIGRNVEMSCVEENGSRFRTLILSHVEQMIFYRWEKLRAICVGSREISSANLDLLLAKHFVSEAHKEAGLKNLPLTSSAHHEQCTSS